MAVLLHEDANCPAKYGNRYKKMHLAEADVLERCAPEELDDWAGTTGVNYEHKT
jgi:hypothetical protein